MGHLPIPAECWVRLFQHPDLLVGQTSSTAVKDPRCGHSQGSWAIVQLTAVRLWRQGKTQGKMQLAMQLMYYIFHCSKHVVFHVIFNHFMANSLRIQHRKLQWKTPIGIGRCWAWKARPAELPWSSSLHTVPQRQNLHGSLPVQHRNLAAKDLCATSRKIRPEI